MKKIALLFVLISYCAFSQGINSYEYVIVPLKFTGFKEKGKYGLNVSTKLLLQKYGFKAFLATDSIPDEIANANCKKLYADLVKDNTMLLTRLKIVIKDCRDKILFETAFGESSEKQLPTAYNQALREAGKSFDKLHYKYNGNFDVAIVKVPGEVPGDIAPEPPAPTKKGDKTEMISGGPDSVNSSSEVFFFAQPIANGYQVVDNEPKVIMKLLNTSQKNVFIGIKGDINGTVILKNGKWFFEYYKNGSLVSEPLNLKF
ncbi:MAG TPA: hypothetical protein PKN96_12955 [Flavobacterium sp.]|uniref:hypothetical protein n=1 Tax=Flavobacterium sp. TaxID=239 RepID=UPI002BF7A4CA|nr:hypothetical protein [Flavobacterium sp.]HNP34194.1 hypothetical protein [Flavobacterium sp.]